MVTRSLAVALQEPENYEVRANIIWSATMALNALIGAGVPQEWVTHMISHEITAEHGLDHAQTLAIVLPSLMTHQKESKREKLLQYAERVWYDSTGRTSKDRSTSKSRDTRSGALETKNPAQAGFFMDQHSA
ncbi:Alcohol dehydrogenase YqhD [Marinobacterium sp. xm-d-579]|uniref:iron-containing alcohol dehydrogenase n=1 Tax=Marinobacterium sp. xm-d-579 TaxID=2497734 RepID=UPI001A0FC5BE|nr:iron-containing alcohol dehydrogenase [Marinobacterium sp. xm-d-579]NRP35638.1 Alcohol dehydrogenase YqhD [Marinobacterium sp. xm-d-579]